MKLTALLLLALSAGAMADDGDGCHTTLSQGFRGYIIPIFWSLSFFATWIMVFMKLMGGKLTQGRGGGWGGGCCRVFLMALCFYQSLFGFFASFSQLQTETVPAMIFPLIGFIAFAGNNQRWLMLYIGVNFFTWQYSGLAHAKGGFLNAWGTTAKQPPSPSKFCNYCDKTEGCQVTCGTAPGTYCAWGWQRTLTTLGVLNYMSFWLTAFAGCSWWAEGASEGSTALTNTAV